MDYQWLLTRLNEVIREEFPDTSNRVELLADRLEMKPNTLYRKLKGERPFSWDELERISGILSVSIRVLIDDRPCVGGYPVGLVRDNNLPVQDRYVYVLNAICNVFEEVSGSGYSKFTGVCRSLPLISCFNYGWLLRTAHLKWLYFSNGLAELPSFSELGDVEMFREVKRMYGEAFASIRHLNYILDGDIIRNFTKDLAFFRKINLISRDELSFVLDDVDELLYNVEEICKQGMRLDSGKELRIFYSEMPFYNDMYLLESSNSHIGVFYAQGIHPVIHRDLQTFYVFRDWVDGWIRCSNPICGIADLERQVFF